MVAVGGLLISGPDAARRYLLSSKRWVSTAFMVVGILLIWSSRTLCILGFFLEVVGFLNLFGPFVSGLMGWMLPLMPASVSGCITYACKARDIVKNRVYGLFRGNAKRGDAAANGFEDSD
jgi:hypothetical protein